MPSLSYMLGRAKAGWGAIKKGIGTRMEEAAIRRSVNYRLGEEAVESRLGWTSFDRKKNIKARVEREYMDDIGNPEKLNFEQKSELSALKKKAILEERYGDRYSELDTKVREERAAREAKRSDRRNKSQESKKVEGMTYKELNDDNRDIFFEGVDGGTYSVQHTVGEDGNAITKYELDVNGQKASITSDVFERESAAAAQKNEKAFYSSQNDLDIARGVSQAKAGDGGINTSASDTQNAGFIAKHPIASIGIGVGAGMLISNMMGSDDEY